MMKTLLVFSLIVLMSISCAFEYRDVSGEDKYVQIVGKHFTTLEEMLIYGYSADDDFETLDGYAITEPPGIAGREILTRGTFPIGSVILLKKIMSCTNCPFPVKKITIEILSDDFYSGKPASLIDTENVFVSRSNGVAVEMNPDLFELVEE